MNATISNETKVNINQISGKYSAVLWNALADFIESIDEVHEYIMALEGLFSNAKYDEAFEILKSLYEIADLKYPSDYKFIERNNNLHQQFLYEIIEDAKDCIG